MRTKEEIKREKRNRRRRDNRRIDNLIKVNKEVIAASHISFEAMTKVLRRIIFYKTKDGIRTCKLVKV